MKTTKKILIGIISTFAIGNAANATVLTFDIEGAMNGNAIPQEYGDRVADASATIGGFSYGTAGGNTPNVLVSYTGRDLSLWDDGYNDLTNVLYDEPESGSIFTIKLTADSGFDVNLAGFDLGNFGNAITLPGVSVTDKAGTELFSQTNIALAASSSEHTSIDFLTLLTANVINININTTGLGGSSDNVGIDNIQFSQSATVVPVPAAVWFLGSALLGFTGFAKRRTA